MTVASVDYEARRVYLDASTVGVDLDTLDIYRDVRELRRTTEAHRRFRPMVVAGGNIQKTLTTFTQPYVLLLYGCRIVPYDTSQLLRVVRETFSDDGFAGRDCFDRTPLTPTVRVDIDYAVDKVEVRVVTTGGSALLADERARLFALPTTTFDGADRASLGDIDAGIAELLSGRLTEDAFKKYLFNRVNTVAGDKITEYTAGDDAEVHVTYNAQGIPTSEALQ